MRKLSACCLALAVALVAIGCDSGTDDETSDAELFVGTWTMTAFEDGEGDRMPFFGQIANGLTATLTASGEFSIFVDYKPASGNDPTTIPGTYTVDEGAKSLVLSPPSGQNIPFSYEFQTDTSVDLSANAAFVNGLFGTDIYQGTVTLTIEK
ncbi:MAG: hypothetical protein WD021_06900 [Rhodothermales bacterium]